jgi:hypothetical protein
MMVSLTIRHREPGMKPRRARRGFSPVGGVTYSVVAHGRRQSHFERERIMAKQFFGGFFSTLAFVAVILAALFGIFTLVSYIAGPVGG